MPVVPESILGRTGSQICACVLFEVLHKDQLIGRVATCVAMVG